MTNPLIQGLGKLCCGSIPIKYTPITDEKRPINPYNNDSGYVTTKPLTVDDTHAIAAKAISALIKGDDRPLKEINDKLSRDAVRATSWAEGLAQSILDHLVEALKSGNPIGDALRDTYNLVRDSAMSTFQWLKDHPEVVCIVIALGILAVLSPWILEVLGFARAGIRAGSWAASWQRTYGGFVPEGSWLSWFQSLGASG